MEGLTYRIVQHDGGWAYKVGDVFSERTSTIVPTFILGAVPCRIH